jgi:hypothetical protein
MTTSLSTSSYRSTCPEIQAKNCSGVILAMVDSCMAMMNNIGRWRQQAAEPQAPWKRSRYPPQIIPAYRPVFTAASVETANGMTARAQTCYAKHHGLSPEAIAGDAEFRNTSVMSPTLTMGDDPFTTGLFDHLLKFQAPCWTKRKRESTSRAVRGKEASLAPRPGRNLNPGWAGAGLPASSS